MKKLFALMLVLVMVCSFAACGNTPAPEPAGKDPAIVAYMEKYGDSLIDSMESSFSTSSGGMACKASWEVEGSTLIINLRIEDLEDVPEATKTAMQEAYDAMMPAYDGIMQMMQSELSELKCLTMNVCEKDGDLLASIVID